MVFSAPKHNLIGHTGDIISHTSDGWKEVLKIGIPAIATQMVIPFSVSLIARIASDYPHGKQLVSALQTAGRVDFFALAVVAALGGVLVSFVAQNLSNAYYYENH